MTRDLSISLIFKTHACGSASLSRSKEICLIVDQWLTFKGVCSFCVIIRVELPLGCLWLAEGLLILFACVACCPWASCNTETASFTNSRCFFITLTFKWRTHQLPVIIDSNNSPFLSKLLLLKEQKRKRDILLKWSIDVQHVTQLPNVLAHKNDVLSSLSAKDKVIAFKEGKAAQFMRSLYMRRFKNESV